MNKLILSTMVIVALAAAGCERKAPDNLNPKTSASGSGSQGATGGTNDSRTGSSSSSGSSSK